MTEQIKQDDTISAYSAYRDEIRDSIRESIEKSQQIIRLRKETKRLQVAVIILDVVAILTAVGAILARFLF